ncbi:Uncharacterised protein [Klebsiella pneumoniae]|nr:Uncharacterised protein [Klebsiella pneumoniae]
MNKRIIAALIAASGLVAFNAALLNKSNFC